MSEFHPGGFTSSAHRDQINEEVAEIRASLKPDFEALLAALPDGEWARVFTEAHERATRQHFTDDEGNDVGVMPGGHAAAAIHHALAAALEAGWGPVPEQRNSPEGERP